jgi:hypothetical protein
MFREHFPNLSYPDAAKKCAEIAAVCAVYGGLLNGSLSESDAEYLMQFENPLKVLAEKWREYAGVGEDVRVPGFPRTLLLHSHHISS